MDDGFEAFYAGSYQRLLGQLFAVTGDLAEAENALQEAYARAFVRWPRVGGYDRPEAWVRRARALLRLGPPPVVPELSPGDGQGPPGPRPGGHGRQPAARPVGGDLMHDLDTRLERLAAEATRDAVAPEPAVIARRGRRRRRRQVAGSALVLAAVVAAGVVLPSRLAGRSGDDPVPATAPPTDVRGAAMIVGDWLGKTDVSVLLDEHVTPAQRGAILRRLQSLDVVDAVYYESQEDAYKRLKARYRNKPGLAVIDPKALPASFRVRLDAPEHVGRVQGALCPRSSEQAAVAAACMDGIDVLTDDSLLLVKTLLQKPAATSSDVTVFLPGGTGDAERDEVRDRLAAIDGVAEVTYEAPEEAYRRLPDKLRRDGLDPAKVTALYSPESVPAAFHVTLDRPARVEAFHRALCGSHRTGACPGDLVVLTHPRR